jgi:TPR repeat protein
MGNPIRLSQSSRGYTASAKRIHHQVDARTGDPDSAMISNIKLCVLIPFAGLLIAATGAAAPAGPAVDSTAAADYKAAHALLWGDRDRDNDAEGLALVRRAADAGYADAQNYLAVLYSTGILVEQDHEQSMHWALKAAAQNHTDAMVRVAFNYLHARGVAHDPVKAREMLEAAAALGSADAMANLGALYGRGDGVAKDDVAASGWYRKAADLGSQHGIWGIANMYSRGEGVENDYGECYYWAKQLDPAQYPKARSMQEFCAGKLSRKQKREVDARLEKIR